MPQTIPPALVEILVDEPTAQRGFGWNRSAWLSQLHDLPEASVMLERLPDRVDRGSVRATVLSEFDADNVLSAFVSAMVWGYGDAGYGPTRVRWVLTGVRGRDAAQASVLSTVSTRLAEAVQTVRDLGAVAGFRLMNNSGHIKYLGPAFFTKWLYFASAVVDVDNPAAAPILDQQVVGWLHKNAGISLNLKRTSSYESYLELLRNWGEPHGRSPVQVEKAIFGLATGRA